MSTPQLAAALTVLCAVIIAVTRVRLAGARSSRGARSARAPRNPRGHTVSPMMLGLHTGIGSLAVILWSLFLAFGDLPARSLIGVVALGGWWTTTWTGLLLLGRWLPSRGKHTDVHDRGWLIGLALAVVGHLGLGASAVWFTWIYTFNLV